MISLPLSLGGSQLRTSLSSISSMKGGSGTPTKAREGGGRGVWRRSRRWRRIGREGGRGGRWRKRDRGREWEGGGRDGGEHRRKGDRTREADGRKVNCVLILLCSNDAHIHASLTTFHLLVGIFIFLVVVVVVVVIEGLPRAINNIYVGVGQFVQTYLILPGH